MPARGRGDVARGDVASRGAWNLAACGRVVPDSQRKRFTGKVVIAFPHQKRGIAGVFSCVREVSCVLLVWQILGL